MKRSCFLLSFVLLLGIFCSPVHAQDPERFKEEVEAIQQKYELNEDQSNIKLLFTGSSSIRMWESLESRFPNHIVLNTGFGGSQTSDLMAYLNELVLQHSPNKIFIYEGDNDIAEGKKPRNIIKTTQEVVNNIKSAGYNNIVLISAKPSIDRWHLKRKYRKFNRKLEKLCEKDPALKFADVWYPMLDGKKLRPELFIEDGLHMNETGYDIWYDVIARFVN